MRGDPAGGKPELVFEVDRETGLAAAVGAAECDGGTAGFEGKLVVSVENRYRNGGGQGSLFGHARVRLGQWFGDMGSIEVDSRDLGVSSLSVLSVGGETED